MSEPWIFEESLGILVIAENWSIESGRSANKHESALIRAWWRGEIRAAIPKRVNVLRAAYRTCREDIAFDVEGQPGGRKGRELEGGGIAHVVRIRIWVPSSDPATWRDESCSRSFKEMAHQWDRLPQAVVELLLPILGQIEIDGV